MTSNGRKGRPKSEARGCVTVMNESL